MANEYLRRNFTSTGNLKVGTFSFWMKGRPYDTNQTRPVYLYDGSNLFQMFFERTSGTNPGQIILYGAGADIRYKGVYRDSSAWSHYLVKIDNTINGAEARFEVYVNGVRLEIVGSQSGSTASYPTRDANIFNNVFYINGTGNGAFQCCDYFFIDGQALTPDVFGFYKQGKGYISVGSTQATDFRPGQWVPKTPRVIKTEINRRGGFGVNGFYLPMNDSNNFGADFHGEPNSIITLNEKLPQPRVGVATTASVGLGYTDALRADPYAANLVLALPFVSGGLSSGFGDYAPSIKGSGSAKTVTINGSVSIASTAGYYGSSSNFGAAGALNYLQVSASSDFAYSSGNFTIETWWFPTSTTRQAIYHGSWGADYSIGIDYNGASSNLKLGMWASSNGSSWNLLNADAGGNGITAGTPVQNQWNHIAYVRNGSTFSMYLNGVCVGTVTGITAAVDVTASDTQVIGEWWNTSAMNSISGYLQDFRIYKGVAKYTGGFDVPRPYTPVGIATWRAVPDTTANNFATMNPLIEARPSSGTNSPSNSTIVTFAGGNLNLSNSASSGNAQRMVSFATIGISTGKWYYEEIPSSNSRVGLSKGFQQLNYIGTLGSGSGLESNVTYGASGAISLANNAYYNTATTLTPPSYNNTNIIGVSIDASLGENNLTVRFYKDGVGVSTLTGVGATSPVREWFPTKTMESSGSGDQRYFNFGQNPTFSGNTTAGTFTDSNGKGLFKYEPPSGFLALCEDNLPTPAISDPGQYFKTVLYAGDGNSGRSIVGVGFTPDLVWIKSRTVARNHRLQDSVRGFTNVLSSDLTNVEYGTGDVSSANNEGFSLLARDNQNVSAESYVAWCWRAGAGTTSTNTNGSITSVVSVNQDAGFSIVRYAGKVGGGSWGHSLGKEPKFIIFKRYTAAQNWFVFHKTRGSWRYFEGLNTTNGDNDYSSSMSASSTVVTLPNLAEFNTDTSSNYIAYCWAEIEGFSKFGSYVGNGNADGPFVYTGGRPAFVMIKRTDSADHWSIFDSSRDSTNNDANLILYANLTNGDSGDSMGVDKLSNGFKIRNTTVGRYNASGATYIYACWMESPFQTANSK